MSHVLEVETWLRKARSDLLSARILVEHGSPVLDAAAFHCQQTVEKTLKAFLCWQSVPFDKVHNLVYLLDLCAAQEPGFASLRETAASLTPYAVEVRCPGQVLDISPEEAREALAAAEAAWDLVFDLLPREQWFSFLEEGSA